MGIFNELKRRNVFRVAVAYLVVAWLLLQVADTLGPLLGISELFNKYLFYGLVIGFVPTVLFSWAFELTPDGIKREKDIERDKSLTHLTAKKLDYITLGALIIVAGLTLWQQLAPNQVKGDEKSSSENLSLVDAIKSETESPSQLALAKGVAVLPFTNLSANQENQYFANGVHEDILTQLSKIDALKIISRTSMINIAKRGYTIDELGQMLNVSHVLEGSVRRDGDKVRVTVQLIDAANDNHVWADNYDRKLEDIFSIQSEIAISIAEQLKAKLTVEQLASISNNAISNTKAYDLYNQARELNRTWRGGEGFREMLPLLQEAVDIEPGFIDAEIMLLEVYGRLVWTAMDLTGDYKKKAAELLMKIETQHPDTGAAYQAKGIYDYTIERNYAQALTYFKKALEQNPKSLDIMSYISFCYKRLGRLSEGVELTKKILEVDPANTAISSELAIYLARSGELQQAIEFAEKHIDKFPNDDATKAYLAMLYISYSGDRAAALAVLDKMPLLSRHNYVNYFQLALDENNLEAIIRQIDSLRNNEPWQENLFDGEVAILRLVSGQQQEAKEIAKKVLNFVVEWLESGKPMVGNNEKISYAWLSYFSCIAEQKALFVRFSEKMESTASTSKDALVAAKLTFSFAEAECGRLDSAWRVLETILDDESVLINDWHLVTFPAYRHYFKSIPAFQKRVDNLNKP
ncbi:MAG: tetratricopeptide repeat protein [Gammaproteobacteria bacterium]|nr:tetratricopeptide repeat protein [Gammaproteobacteria bacterium]